MSTSGWTTPRPLIALALFAGVLAAVPGTARAGGDWNDKEIKWRSYDEGLAEAKKSKKPICLVIYTEWCPHCTNYSKLFHDPKVVEKAKQFVMIRLDADKNQELAKKYALDGSYIPRTYFLSPAGVVDTNVHAPREQYKYFYDERNPASVLAAMDAAAKQIKN